MAVRAGAGWEEPLATGDTGGYVPPAPGPLEALQRQLEVAGDARAYVPLAAKGPLGPPAHGPLEALREQLEAFFCIRERGSSIAREVCAGFVTWVTMSYIVVVNPMILSATSATGGPSPIPFHTACLATCLTAAVATGFVGLTANLPFGLAAGMGLNSYLRYGVMARYGLSAEAALSCCFVQAAIFAVLAASGAADWLQAMLPGSLKAAITVAIGIFQAFVGFQLMGLVVADNTTLVALGDLEQPTLWLSVVGTLLVAVLLIRKTKGALLIGIFFVTVAANLLGLPNANDLMGDISPSSSLAPSTLFTPSLEAAMEDRQAFGTIVLCMLFIVVFDTAGVQYGIGQQAGLIGKDDRLPGASFAYIGSALGTGLGAFLGTSPVIIHNESAAGVQEGGRTGLCAVTTAVLFLASPALVPLIELIPPEATAPCLVIIGTMMMVPVRDVDFTDLRVALPAFLIICVTPLTFSISAGIFSGIAAYFMLAAMMGLAEAGERAGAALAGVLRGSAPGHGAPESTPYGHHAVSLPEVC